MTDLLVIYINIRCDAIIIIIISKQKFILLIVLWIYELIQISVI